MKPGDIHVGPRSALGLAIAYLNVAALKVTKSDQRALSRLASAQLNTDHRIDLRFALAVVSKYASQLEGEGVVLPSLTELLEQRAANDSKEKARRVGR